MVKVHFQVKLPCGNSFNYKTIIIIKPYYTCHLSLIINIIIKPQEERD